MSDWVTSTGGVALGGALVLALVLARSGAAGVVARFELVRLARGGRQPLLRGLVALGTLLGLMLAYLRASDAMAFDALAGRVELPRDRLAGVGETLLFSFLAVETLAIYLAAPVVAAAGIAKEKERKTLDDLLGTGLTPWDVVAGKFLASWLYVLGVAAAGAPALVAASLFGGVDFVTLIGGAVVIVYGSALLCAAAVRSAARAAGLREALTPLYFALGCLAVLGLVGGVIPGVAFASPASAMLWLGVARGAVGAPWVALAVGLVAVTYAVYCWLTLRLAARSLTGEPPVPPPRLPARGDFPQAVPVYGVEARERVAVISPGVPEEGVFVWKERRGAEGDRAVLTALTVAGMMFGAIFVTAAATDWNRHEWPGDSFNPVARLGLLAFAVVAPLVAGVRAAGSVARERERGTLDGLLATPAERSQILAAKFAGATRGALAMGLGLLALLVAAAAFGGVYPPGALAGFAAGAGSTLLMAALGSYFSAGARTSLRAVLAVTGCLFFLWVGPVALSPLAPPGVGRAFVTALSPPVGAFRSGGVWRFYRAPAGGEADEAAVLASGFVGVGGTVMAVGVWVMARRRFERLGR